MFQRVIHENWTSIAPIVSFVLTAAVFTFVTIRAISMPKAEREELAHMPLEDNSENPNKNSK